MECLTDTLENKDSSKAIGNETLGMQRHGKKKRLVATALDDSYFSTEEMTCLLELEALQLQEKLEYQWKMNLPTIDKCHLESDDSYPFQFCFFKKVHGIRDLRESMLYYFTRRQNQTMLERLAVDDKRKVCSEIREYFNTKNGLDQEFLRIMNKYFCRNKLRLMEDHMKSRQVFLERCNEINTILKRAVSDLAEQKDILNEEHVSKETSHHSLVKNNDCITDMADKYRVMHSDRIGWDEWSIRLQSDGKKQHIYVFKLVTQEVKDKVTSYKIVSKKRPIITLKV